MLTADGMMFAEQPRTSTPNHVQAHPHPNTPQQVREVAAEAIARARRGDGPTLIEAETYRFRGHSLADPDELRTKEEKDHYAVWGGLVYVVGVLVGGYIHPGG